MKNTMFSHLKLKNTSKIPSNSNLFGKDLLNWVEYLKLPKIGTHFHLAQFSAHDLRKSTRKLPKRCLGMPAKCLSQALLATWCASSPKALHRDFELDFMHLRELFLLFRMSQETICQIF